MRRVLIANRGEIAVRVIRACRDLGIESVAVYSDADAEALHVKLADAAVRIGAAPSAESYLNIEAILGAARSAGADGVHPGYGFLSENADFARQVQAAGLTWIGPTADVIERMGDKAQARAMAISAGVPVVPGTGVLADLTAARSAAAELGYPVLLKAAEGGGGKGIRQVADESELGQAFDEATREVTAAFGAASLYLEKSLTEVRHIEVQLLGDTAGNVVHLHERDCSLQRRRQKIVEEAPAPDLPESVRAEVHRYAVELGRAMGYTSAGTVEFLVAADGGIYFIEVNARIQVEHGITELITGVDVCAAQLRIAAGETIGFSQHDVQVSGHAIELRVNAENPNFHFLGSPGTITSCRLPLGPGIRVDTYIESGAVVQPHYDSLIAKVMAVAPDRESAVARLRRALNELTIDGVLTTAAVGDAILASDWLGSGNYSTTTLESALADLVAASAQA